MGAPTTVHDARVSELRTLATLAGFTVDVRLPWRLRPDVARLCPVNLALLVADAKHTEDPTCTAMLRRFRWYATAMVAMPTAADAFTVALAVPGTAAPRGWSSLVVSAVACRMVCAPPQWTAIGGTIVVVVRAGHARSGRDYPYRDRPWPAWTNNALSAPSTSSVARAA